MHLTLGSQYWLFVALKTLYLYHTYVFSFLKKYLFIYLWLRRVLLAAGRLFVAVCGLLSSCGSRAPERVGSLVVARGLSCPVACGILVSRPGIKLVSPALQDQFLTTGPPGKSPRACIFLFERSTPLRYHFHTIKCTHFKCIF